jgi:hypothetical protein
MTHRDLEGTYRYAQKYAPDLLTKDFAKARDRAKTATEIDKADRANLRPVGTNQYSEGVYNKKSDVHTRPEGNTAAAFIRRLRKGRPDIHGRVLAGEMTPHAGMIEAGFRQKAPSRKQSPFEAARKAILEALPSLTPEERHKLKEMLG